MHDNQINQSFKDITKKELATFLVLNNKSHTHVNWKKKTQNHFPGIICFVNLQGAGF